MRLSPTPTHSISLVHGAATSYLVLLLVASGFAGAANAGTHATTVPSTTYLVNFAISPTTCPAITFNGTSQSTGSSASFLAGPYTAVAHSCTPFVFEQWNTSGGVAVLTPKEATSTIQVLGAGSLTAWYVWPPPAEFTVNFTISPPGCGPVLFNDVEQANGSTALEDGGTYSLAASTCVGYNFVQWNATGPVTVADLQSSTTNVLVKGSCGLGAWFTPMIVPPSLRASIAAVSYKGTAPFTAEFSSSVEGGSSPYTYAWTFGDGSTGSTAANPSHLYTKAGTFPVQLTVTDSAGDVVNAFLNVTVASPLTATLAFAPQIPVTGGLFFVNGTPQGGAAPYYFSWPTLPSGCSASPVAELPCVLEGAGTFGFEIQISDSNGRVVDAWTNVTVKAAPPPSQNPGATTSTSTVLGLAPSVFVGVVVVAPLAGLIIGFFVTFLLSRRGPGAGGGAMDYPDEGSQGPYPPEPPYPDPPG